MDELKEKTGNLGKSIFKRMVIPIIILFIVITMLMGSIYSVFNGDIRNFIKDQENYKELLKKAQEARETRVTDMQIATVRASESRYNRVARMEESSIQIVSDQNYSLSKEIIIAQQKVADIIDVENNGTKVATTSIAEEIAAGMSFLGDYIKDSPNQTKEQKLAYLMNSEIVTMYPYLGSNPGDETKINGIIRFYRYLNSVEDGASREPTEKIELTYINKEGFNAKFEQYKNSGNQDVLKYFTLDDDQNVVIAYGTIETKTITTTDNELTLDKINEMSTQTYTKIADGVYESKTYTVATKPIDYQSYVEQYVLPFGFLATLLVQTRDYELVKEIADLAYESELAIGIYDNKSVTENNEEYTYNKKIKYTENTEIVFDNIKTDPKVNISSSRYSQVIKECFGKLDETKEKSIHTSGIKLEDLETAAGNRTDGKVHEAYISSISQDGVVTGITTSPYEFKTTFNIKTIANSTPTVDIAIADIWAGKYTSTYIKEESNPPAETNTYALNDEEFIKIDTNKFAQNILNEDGEIGKKLKSHSQNLRTLAIAKIIEKTDFTVNPRAMTVEDISSHAGSCDTCKAELEAKYGESWKEEITTNENVLNEVKTLDDLKTVKQHVEQVLKDEAKAKTEERKQKFITDINKQGQITYKQWPTVYKSNISISNTKTYSKTTSTYKKDTTKTENLGKKFASIFQDDKFYESKQSILQREEWVWEALKKYEATSKIENLLRYLFNIAFDTQEFGEFSQADIEKLFTIFEPKKLVNSNIGNTMSPFGTQMTREEFIQAVQNYNGGTYYSILSNVAEDFYDVCTLSQYNVNPCLAFAWACLETEYGKHIPDKNLFGMGIDNGQTSGEVYTSYKDSIEDFCRWVIRHSTSAGTKARAQEYATVNSKFNGDPENNIYALFCGYMYLGHTHIADEPDFNNPAGYNYYNENGSNWGSGGRIYIYHMYERGGLYKGEYATRCGHSNGSDETTLQEKADYVQYSVESRIKIARNIFGNGIFLGGEGTYEKINDKDKFGVYTSSSGRTYTEWIQSSRTTWGGLYLNAWSGTMAQYGCGLYTSTMLLNSVGIDITPGDFYNKFNYDFLGTIQSILNEYRVEGKAKMVYSSDYNKYFSVLLDGHGVMSYLSSQSDYTNNKHWIAVSDIRETQTGSRYGYDLYVLSSTHKSRSGIWMGSSGRSN